MYGLVARPPLDVYVCGVVNHLLAPDYDDGALTDAVRGCFPWSEEKESYPGVPFASPVNTSILGHKKLCRLSVDVS